MPSEPSSDSTGKSAPRSGSGLRGWQRGLLRVDPAGNISKRYAGESFPFSHFGGTCPRWHLHAAFQTPGQTIRQLIETPDGQRYFTISRTIERPIRPDLRDDALLAIGLGCDIRYARCRPCIRAPCSSRVRRDSSGGVGAARRSNAASG